ncbi:DMT family transporter [Wenxinia marina]|uniref:EamA-like transporter family n=1 Tax=Wenxinia marina DSM 24838 TaxID=1123501 RepID=A0A0D0Q7X1_9RHOB|nr:DMT family transporter [Wenxinia marina]KIQ68537.1 EamA-like transporter family [Wenxinia marina DSM 24838]GGL66709.1 membrane protein [Wenxinia marina]
MTEDTGRTPAAIAMVLGGMAVYGFVDNFVRLAAPEGSLWQFHLMRSALAMTLILAAALLLRQSLRPQRTSAVLLRSAVATISMVIYFACLGLLPIAQVVAGLFTAPIFVVLYEVAFFGLRIGPRRILAVLVGFVGIVVALRPGSGEVTWLTLLPVVAGALYGAGNVVTRRFCATEGTLTLLLGFFGGMATWGALGLVVVGMLGIAAPEGPAGWPLRGWGTPDDAFLLVVVLQSVGSIAGVGLSIRAYQLADATTVAVFENTLLVFATAWAAILWGEVPTGRTLAGLSLIAGAGVLISLRTDAPQPLRSPATGADAEPLE